MGDAAKMARDSAMLDGITPYLKTGSSRYDEGLKKQYLADATRLYAAEVGEAASNVYDAQCQGIGSGDWYDWNPVRIRVSPAAVASTGETMPDDWQKLHILKPVGVDTVPIGAYLTFAGNTWIVYKGRNMGSVLGDGIIRRCNSVINVLDWYGNIVPVPMSYAKMGTLGNASHATENSIVAKNYISCICQLNQYSAAFTENTRIILGKTAYSMRGVNDFTREFTDDQDSVHLLTFTIERSAPLPQDRLDLQCADYDSFHWELDINAPEKIPTRGSAQIQVSSYRMGKPMETTEEHPISYKYKSSSPLVASVDENGLITTGRLSVQGTATITVSLAQNPSIQKSFVVQVTSEVQSEVVFTNPPPRKLAAFDSAIIQAWLFRGGEKRNDVVTLTCSGPPAALYSIEAVDLNVWRITAYGASSVPLTVRASTIEAGQDIGASAEITLTEG